MAALAGRAAGSRARWLEPDSLLFTTLLLVMVLTIAVPLALLVVTSFQETGDANVTYWTLEGWRRAFQSGLRDDTLWNTISIAVTRTAISLPIAVVIAWLLARTDLPGKSWLEFLFWIAFFLPTLPVVQGWVLVFAPNIGLANRLVADIPILGAIKFDIFSWWGIIFAHLVTGTVAVKVMLLTPMFRNMDASQEEASRICGDSALGALWRIVIPVMRPAILLVMLIAIIRSLESFEVELFLGAPDRIEVYSTAIYRMINREPALYGAATALSIMILALMVPLILLHRWATARRRFGTMTGQYKGQPMKLRTWRWPVFAVVFAITLIFTLLPILFLVIGSFMRIFGWFEIENAWTTRHWVTVFETSDLANVVMNTMVLGLGAAVFGAVLYTLIAYISLRTKFWGRQIVDGLSWVPLALPGVILGLGMLLLFLEIPALRFLYGGLVPLIVAVTLGTMTTGVQITRAAMQNLGFDIEEASWSVGASKMRTLRSIVVPILSPVLVAVAVLSFVSAVRNVSFVALLSTGNIQPLAMQQLHYAVDGNYEAGAVVGLIIVAITVVVAIIARAFSLKIAA